MCGTCSISFCIKPVVFMLILQTKIYLFESKTAKLRDPEGYNIEIRSGRPSANYDLKTNHTAYFIQSRGHFPNLHHFFNDFGIVFFTIQNQIQHLPQQR